MAQATFKQGEDAKIVLEMLDGGTNLDMSVCTNIKATLKVAGIEQMKFALVPETDYGQLEVEAAPNTNKIDLFVTRDKSMNFPTGVIQVVVLAEFPDIEFPDGGKTREFSLNVGRVLKGEWPTEPMP